MVSQENKFADLHMHTVASDGTDTVEQRTKQAKNHKIDVIAITDHDTLNSGFEERSFHKNGVEVISGAEIKAEIDGNRIEILGYFLDADDRELSDLVEKNREYRIKRMEEMVKKVNQMSDKSIDIESVMERSKLNPGRPHLAEEMVEKGIVANQNQAFEEYIGRECPGYIPTEKVKARKVIEAIHNNGGAASLAHPGRDLTKAEADKIVKSLAEIGIDGLEVEYTYRHKIQTGFKINFTEVYANCLAEKHDLIKTGGSDCHGEDSNKHNIGKVKLPCSNLQKLKNAARSYRN